MVFKRTLSFGRLNSKIINTKRKEEVYIKSSIFNKK